MLDASIDTAENFNLEDTLGKERQNFGVKLIFSNFLPQKHFYTVFLPHGVTRIFENLNNFTPQSYIFTPRTQILTHKMLLTPWG